LDDLLKDPVVPFEITPGLTVRDAVRRMGKTSFQARSLCDAATVWESMLRDGATVFMGLAGAMVPAGMRKVVAGLIEVRFIDCLVSTGANLFHDCVETLGKKHWKGDACTDDVRLRRAGVDRIYDIFAREGDFVWAGSYIRDFAAQMAGSGPYSTREFLYHLGKQLASDAKEEGILTTAARKNVPVYCPGLSDSSIGIELAVLGKRGGKVPGFDIIGDVRETADIAAQSKKTGVVYVGGGIPKNFIQQTQVTLSILDTDKEGHDYAVQIITDPPHWGGLSGCTFVEAQSWGKIADKAGKATVYCDATVALPLLAVTLWDSCSDIVGRERIAFSMGRVLGVTLN
jgi:deoxyhypusine synthase